MVRFYATYMKHDAMIKPIPSCSVLEKGLMCFIAENGRLGITKNYLANLSPVPGYSQTLHKRAYCNDSKYEINTDILLIGGDVTELHHQNAMLTDLPRAV